MLVNLNEDFWTQRYLQGKTGWDIGYPSTPLLQYLDQIENSGLELLIPGAGNAHEAVYAFQKGLVNTHILDISTIPLENFRRRFPDFPTRQIHHQNFFDHLGSYDLILEQTFFCALDPSLRPAYCEKMKSLLKPSGKLVGVLFDRDFEQDGPPFGGSLLEYQAIFSSYFKVQVLEACYNSIPQRTGTEVFLILENQ
ncbi:SAM-dependent methyltransferase [Algoriphagus sp. CAU 1675]|uniref:SAM-dependent methyltransferase n=1 Tax=Algoriphagus sp. CAU 1675 TaxID=3032597 RepID=UPI0023DC4680|nr:SAM-dependent methyltransferase [Algoriphagus sp. CAU 1675]MDF2157440.1 SAM-dependent methyltransferase [Algoriphagus sp. CAU 1675]